MRAALLVGQNFALQSITSEASALCFVALWHLEVRQTT
jgi:hypothetical protein